jgi:tetratricopeptide (TPR) repeat protein
MNGKDYGSSQGMVPTERRDLAPVAIANPLVSRGMADLTNGRMSQVRSLDPQTALRCCLSGIAWCHRKDCDKAIQDFEEAIRLNPSNPVLYICLGIARSRKADYDQAIQAYDEALRLDPTEANGYKCRGIAWLGKKDYDEAIKDFDEAIHLDPKNTAAIFSRGNAWFDKEDYGKAIRDYDEVIRLDSKNSACYFNRGLALLRKKDYDSAVRNYDEAIRLNPNDAALYYYRGHAFGSAAVRWFGKKDFTKASSESDRAITDFNEAIRLGPNNPLALDRAYKRSQHVLKLLLPLKELTSGSETYSNDSAICKRLFKETVDKALTTLSHEEREVIKLLYGLDDGYAHTYKEIGPIIKATTGRVRLIAATALLKFAPPIRSSLQDFLDIVATLGLHLGDWSDRDTFRLVKPDSSPLHLREGIAICQMSLDPDPAFDDRNRPLEQRSDPGKAAILAKPIAELNLSKYTRECLQSLKIHSLRDLVSRTTAELLESRDFGMACLNEVHEKLRQFDLPLRDESFTGTQRLSDRAKAAMLAKPPVELELSVRAATLLELKGINTIYDLILRTAEELLEIRNFGVGETTLGEIRLKLSQCGLKLRGD